MNFYSQFGEDEWVFKNVPDLPKKGFFCEVGAFDGRASSNTLAFEEMGWEGICIEPDPEIANQCRHNRRAFTITCAVDYTLRGFGRFHINRSDRGTSGLWRPATGDHIEVPVKTLEEILNAHNLSSLDLLSIDTEGSELEVWKSLGDHCRPKIAIIEFLTEPGGSRLDGIKEQLEKDKYRLVHTTHANAIFVPA